MSGKALHPTEPTRREYVGGSFGLKFGLRCGRTEAEADGLTVSRRSEMRLGRRYGLEIRTVAAADAGGVAEMLAAAGCPVPGADLAGRLEALRHGSGTALLALEWGPPSGIVVLHWYPALWQAAPVAQITTLLVAPDDRRRGIGRQLLKSASQAARMAGCDSLQLLAGPEAADLAAFGRATGFVDAPGGFVRPLRKKS